MANVQDRWLSVEKACKHIRVSSDTVYRLIDRSAMPAHKMGRKRKFKRDQVNAWVESGCAVGDARGEETEGGVK